MFDRDYENSRYAVEDRDTNFMARIYGWMCLALGLTAVTAYYMATPRIVTYLMTHTALIIGLFIAQIAIVVAISGFINKLNTSTALILFLTYAILTGVTISGIFLVYKVSSIYLTFIVTAGMFGAMSLYGYFTRTDLTSIGNIGFMALIGLIIGSVVNIFLKSSTLDFILSSVGVVLFTLLTAYDVQKLKQVYSQLTADRQTMSKIAIVGALTLYLDFINLFLFLLRFMGKRQDD